MGKKKKKKLEQSNTGSVPLHLKKTDVRDLPSQIMIRDWGATENSTLVQSYWGQATGANINVTLARHLNDMIKKSMFEARRNAIVDGTINSHANDVVGPKTPTIEFQTDDEKWNERAESIWSEIAEKIDGSGEMSLADVLRQDIRSLWTTGGILSQYVHDPEAHTTVTQRLHVLSCSDLYSGRFNTTDTMLGIKRNSLGRPISYYIVESGLEVQSYGLKLNPVEIPARDIQHVFIKHEPKQWRGYPWLSSSLQVIAELGDYDSYVLDAAKIAAQLSVLFFTTRDDVQPEVSPRPFSIQRQSTTQIPAGWQPYELNANHPTATHESFKADKLRDLGRSVSMPLMAIQRDASNHNYSSARFDGQGYARANESIQNLLETKRIMPFCYLALSEAMLRGALPRKPLSFYRDQYQMIWPKPPHVDPLKEAMAQRIQMENKTMSPQQACLANNADFEKICKDWKRANEILKANGLPEMLGPIPTDPIALANLLKDDDDKKSK